MKMRTLWVAALVLLLALMLASCGGGGQGGGGGSQTTAGKEATTAHTHNKTTTETTTTHKKAPPVGVVKSYSNLSRNHTKEPVDYPQTPPVGGPHNPIWQNCGFYSKPVRNEHAVHSMEHGAVWITYSPTFLRIRSRRSRASRRRATYSRVRTPAYQPQWWLRRGVSSSGSSRPTAPAWSSSLAPTARDRRTPNLALLVQAGWVRRSKQAERRKGRAWSAACSMHSPEPFELPGTPTRRGGGGGGGGSRGGDGGRKEREGGGCASSVLGLLSVLGDAGRRPGLAACSASTRSSGSPCRPVGLGRWGGRGVGGCWGDIERGGGIERWCGPHALSLFEAALGEGGPAGGLQPQFLFFVGGRALCGGRGGEELGGRGGLERLVLFSWLAPLGGAVGEGGGGP